MSRLQIEQCTLEQNLGSQLQLARDELNWRLLELEEERRDYFQDMLISDIAGSLNDDFFLPTKSDEDANLIFQRIISFGLQFGLSSEDFKMTVQEIVVSGDESSNQFLSGFASIVSLRVAEQLHYQNIENGGVYSDFDMFVTQMESVIADGKINIKWSSDEFLPEGSDAMFYPITRTVVLSPIYMDTALYPLASTVAHEFVHASDFLQNRIQHTLKTEFLAYVVGDTITALFEDNYLTAGNPEIDAISEKIDDLSKQSFEAALGCRGLSEGVIAWWLNVHTAKLANRRIWRDAVWKKAYGMRNIDMKPIFEDYYRYTYFEDQFDADVGDLFDLFGGELPAELTTLFSSDAKKFMPLCCERSGIALHGVEHGEAAFRCMNNIFFEEMMACNTQSVSETFLGKDSACLHNVFDIADFIVDGLLYYVIPYSATEPPSL